MKRKMTALLISISVLISMLVPTGMLVPAFGESSDSPPSLIPINKRASTRGVTVYDENFGGLEVLEILTDPRDIQARVDAGLANLSDKGELPLSITTYIYRDDSSEGEVTPAKAGLVRAATINVNKIRHYDGQYFDEYDRYKIDGPSTFTQSYTKTGTRNWNASMKADVKVGVNVVKLKEVEAAVSGSVGYTFGTTESKTSSYSVNIPDKKYWEIKVYVSYLVYEYAAAVDNTTVSTGYTWRPNGLVISKNEYNK